MYRFKNTEKGLTLAELLAALALMGIVSMIIVSYLTNGMHSFRKVNEEISLHDEANYIIRRFENEILEATNIVKAEPTDPLCSEIENCQIITITKTNPHSYEEIEVSLGFKDHLALVNEEILSSKVFNTLDDDRAPTITIIENPNRSEWYIQIRLVVENQKTDFLVELESQIPFVKVE